MGKDFAIIGGGEMLDYGAALPLLAGRAVIAADSGLRHCEAMKARPDFVVGDFDSHTGPLPPGVPKTAFDPVDKDYTDSTMALELALEQGAGDILFLGMLGGRLDHTLANLQNLARCARLGIPCRLTDGVTHVWGIRGPARFCLPRAEGSYFSLLSHSPQCKGVTILGAKYALDRYTLTNMIPRAVSNEFLEDDVWIHLEEGLLLITSCPMSILPRP